MSATPRKKNPGGGGGGQNIQVFVRCRPLNKAEKEARSYSVVDTPTAREVSVKEKQNSGLTKTFQFDRVFGIKSSQLEVYRSVVEPLIKQVMQGYNCTVFAYGQTGTGKTFTMEGGEGRDDPGTTWENDPTAGIVPRALAQLFDDLRLVQDAEFGVTVSYLELYNEEIFDLLSAADDTTRLKLYEDSSKKGSVIITGLEEVKVHNKREVYSILERGSHKRKTAETLMNAHSSRSHTVFTVTVHLKESSVEGEEVLRIGKLNLVDLAGSENIGRSGAQDKRAREAGNINQSLLTLGRVITCLVERTPHVPYRESKLTRLLQDSLGGRTKTSIIATISPAGINLEETMSTLDYAHRAKNIQNRPEVNQKLSKKTVIKEYTEEIERLRRDLMASREKNGVFLANENYQSLLAQIECQSQEITEKIGQIKAMTEEMEKNAALFQECEAQLKETTDELESTSTRLQETSHTLDCTKAVLHKTATERDEQQHLVEKHVETELQLSQQAKKLLTVSDATTTDLKLLHEKLDRTRKVERTNEDVKEEFLGSFRQSIQNLLETLQDFRSNHESSCSKFSDNLKAQVTENKEQLTSLTNIIQTLVDQERAAGAELAEVSESAASRLAGRLSDQTSLVTSLTDQHSALAGQLVDGQMSPLLDSVLANLVQNSRVLETLEASVLADLSSLVELFSTFAAGIEAKVGSVKARVDQYVESNTQKMDSVDAKSQLILESEKRMKAALDAVMQQYQEHASLVADTTSVIGKELESGRSAGQTLLQGVSQDCEQTGASLAELKVSTAELSKAGREKVGHSKAACLEVNRTIRGQLTTVSSSIDSFVGQNKALLDKFVETSTENKEKLATDSEEFKASYDKHTKEMAKRSSRFEAEARTSLTSITELNERSSSARLASLSDISSISAAGVAGAVGLVETAAEQVTEFMTDTLQKDVPTGLTPARAERVYPRYLAATSPHQRILERFRAASETVNVAARLPLDDLDDDDSVVTTSTVSSSQISRANSVGSIRSVSGRRGNLSREPSGDLQDKPRCKSAVSASSSTSDIYSLASEDAENRNPVMPAPQGRPVARTRSKREIPRLDPRARKHLGSSN